MQGVELRRHNRLQRLDVYQFAIIGAGRPREDRFRNCSGISSFGGGPKLPF